MASNADSGSFSFTWDGDASKQRVFVIVIDTTRADHMSYLGYSRETTPNLDALAEQSVVFTNAQSPSTWTLPSYASLLTGTRAENHSYYDFDHATATSPYVQLFNAKGYATASIQTNGWVTGLDDDFGDQYRYDYLASDDNASADSLAVTKAEEWVASHPDQPTFVMLGLISPHRPYVAWEPYFSQYVTDATFATASPEVIQDGVFNSIPEFSGYLTQADLPAALRRSGASDSDRLLDSRYYVAAYDAEISHVDEVLGEFFDYLKAEGIYDDSLIVVTSDHGESFMEHGVEFAHGDAPYQSEVHVPLLIKYPSQTEQVVVSDWVSTVGLLSTVVDYYGYDQPATDGAAMSLAGVTLSPGSGTQVVTSYSRNVFSSGLSVIDNGADALYLQTIFPANQSWSELYDLGADPDQLVNLTTRNVGGYAVPLTL